MTIATMEISRESVESALSLYLRQEILGDSGATIGGDETIDAIFERSPDLVALGKNGLGLELASFLAPYGIASHEVAAYDPKKVTFNQAVDLIRERARSKQ